MNGTVNGTVATAVLVAVLASASPAQAGQPFLPGQLASQRLAARVMHPPCAWVGVAPITTTDVAELGGVPKGTTLLGLAWPGECRIAIDPSGIWNLAEVSYFGDSERTIRREVEIIACSVIVHEYGHLAGLQHDESDPHSVMAPDVGYTWPPCRALFPARRLPRRHGHRQRYAGRVFAPLKR